MSKSEVSIAIPDELIKTLVMAEVTKALGSQEQMIAAVVKTAMERKENSYDRETVFQKQVLKHIGDMAAEAFKEWLTANAATVKAAVLRELNKNKAKFADQLTTALLDGRFYVQPTISVKIGTEDR